MAQTGRKRSACTSTDHLCLSTGTCTTTGSKAWEPTALMGCTAWKPCESPVFFSVFKSSCAFIPSSTACRKGLVSLGQPHCTFTRHQALRAAAGLALGTSPASRCPGHDASWGGGRLDFLPASVQAVLAVLMLQRSLCMWEEWLGGGSEALDTNLVLVAIQRVCTCALLRECPHLLTTCTWSQSLLNT